MHKDHTFLSGKPLKFKDVEGIKKAKQYLLSGLLMRALTKVRYLQLSEPEEPALHYLVGRIYYQMNFYEEALESYDKITNDSRYFQKALTNKASVYCQAREFKSALELVNSVNTSTMLPVEKIKHELKRANILKRASFFPQAKTLLHEIEGELQVLQTQMEDPKLFKLMFKVLRELARLANCCKDPVAEQTYE